MPLAEVEKDTIAIVHKDKACSQQFTYIFDGYLHKTADAFVHWFASEFGAPSFHLQLQADKDLIQERFRKRNEIEGDELNEDQLAELESQKKAAEAEKKVIDQALKDCGGKTRVIELNTDASLESTLERLRSDFCAKVILINHENRLHVDTACANLAIKFNMLYVSVFQLIKEHIEKQTPIGKALAKSYQCKDLKDASSVKIMDKESLACQEFEFSAVHYELPIVIQLIKETIMAKRTD